MKIFLNILVITIGLQIVIAQNIIIDDQRTAQNLVENVLLNNTGCASVSNFVISGGNFGAGENSFGYFDGNGSIFPFQEGLILSTGKANDAPGPNTGIISGSVTGWTGFDSEVAAVLNETNTFNATSLEFDFVPLVDYMSFEYIFASEEYTNAFMCNFSDVFGFLIKEASAPDSDYVNIALVPGTTTPVKVTTIHPAGFCDAVNETYFNGFNDFAYPTNFNGQTVAMIAESTVIPGVTYHIKLIIADDQDQIYDSAVFLRAGSFNIGTFLGEDLTLATLNPVCGDEEIELDAGEAVTYQWYKDGILLDEEINRIYTVTPVFGNGTYSVNIDLGGGCLSSGEIEIEYEPLPIVQGTTINSCRSAETNTAIFDLTEPTFIDFITLSDSSLIIEGFYLTMQDAQNDPTTNAIANISSYETAINQPIYAKFLNAANCVNFATITLDILEYPEVVEDEEIYYCLDTFPNTINLNSGLVVGNNPLDYTYIWTTGEETSSININEVGDYTVEVFSADNCSVTRTITVLPSEIATFQNVLITDTIHENSLSIIVEVIGEGDYEYAINLNPFQINNDEFFQDSNAFEDVSYGLHNIYIRDKNSCGFIVEEVILLEYPKHLTPNNDGYYDRWNLNNINALQHNFNSISNVTIFDRTGKVIAIIDPKGLGWDGNYQGNEVPPADYWFVVTLIDFNGKSFTKRGHFSLNRI